MTTMTLTKPKKRLSMLAVLAMGAGLGWTVILGIVFFVWGMIIDNFFMDCIGIAMVWLAIWLIFRLFEYLGWPATEE